MSLERILVISDVHVPYHDPVTKKVYQLGKDIEVDKVVINGDFLDCGEISRYTKSYKLKSFREELDAGKRELDKILEITEDVVYVGGNHDRDRLKKYVRERAPALEGLVDEDGRELLSIDKLLGMEERGIKFIDDRFWEYKGILFSHINKSSKYGGYAAKNVGMDYAKDVIHGHTHKVGLVTMADYSWIEEGTLALPAHYDSKPSTEVQGFVIASIKGKERFYEVVRIKKGHFVFGGEYY